MVKKKLKKRNSSSSDSHNLLGKVLFSFGLLLVIVLGLMNDLMDVSTRLLIFLPLGLLVGLLNVSSREMTGFLVASIALMLSGAILKDPLLGIGQNGTLLNAFFVYFGEIFANLTMFVAPASLIVAIRGIWTFEKD
jgi:hypothetical protein